MQLFALLENSFMHRCPSVGLLFFVRRRVIPVPTSLPQPLIHFHLNMYTLAPKTSEGNLPLTFNL